MLGLISISHDLDHERAIEYARKAISVNPSGAWEHTNLSLILSYSGQTEHSLVAIKKAFELSPIAEALNYHALGTVALFSGRYEEAIDNLRICLEKTPDIIWSNVSMTIACMMTGNEAEGRAQAKEVLRVSPKFSVATSPTVRRIKDQKLRERFADALRRAGLP
jgi:tetratricopeptide (TPR) repeat protein